MIQTRAMKFPARHFLLHDSRYYDAWAEDEQTMRRMVKATCIVCNKLGAADYRFIRTPQGGYAPGIFKFNNAPDRQAWEPTGEPHLYTPRKDTVEGIKLFDYICEIPSCAFMKVLSVACVDDVANIAMPPNQVLMLQGKLYLVWYAPQGIPTPFTGATEIAWDEFERAYFESLAKEKAL